MLEKDTIFLDPPVYIVTENECFIRPLNIVFKGEYCDKKMNAL